MIKRFQEQDWFCCPECGQKIHPVVPGACGVFAVCKAKVSRQERCNWRGEVCWRPNKEGAFVTEVNGVKIERETLGRFLSQLHTN